MHSRDMPSLEKKKVHAEELCSIIYYFFQLLRWWDLPLALFAISMHSSFSVCNANSYVPSLSVSMIRDALHCDYIRAPTPLYHRQTYSVFRRGASGEVKTFGYGVTLNIGLVDG
jgi:hypothetical protein